MVLFLPTIVSSAKQMPSYITRKRIWLNGYEKTFSHNFTLGPYGREPKKTGYVSRSERYSRNSSGRLLHRVNLLDAANLADKETSTLWYTTLSAASALHAMDGA